MRGGYPAKSECPPLAYGAGGETRPDTFQRQILYSADEPLWVRWERRN